MNPCILTRRMRLSIGALAAMVAAAMLAAIVVATTFFAASALGDVLLRWEGEKMTFSSNEVVVVSNSEWNGGAALKYTGEAAPSYSTAVSQAGNAVTIRAKARIDPAIPGAWPVVEAYKNNARDPANKIATFTVNTTTFANYTASAAIPRDTTKILVKAAGAMAGNQILWLDTVKLHYTPAATTPPDTTPPPVPTISAGQSEGSTMTTNDDVSFSFSATEAGASYECRLYKSGEAAPTFEGCTSPKSYTDLGNGSFVFEVRAFDAAGNRSAAEVRNFSIDVPPPVPPCEGTQVTQGQDLDAIVNADPAATATTFCVQGGTYPLSQTLSVRAGDKIIGPAVPTVTVNHSTFQQPVEYPGEPAVHITNGNNLGRMIQMIGGNNELKWVDVGGAVARYSDDTEVTCPTNWSEFFQRCPINGTGIGVAMGQAAPSSKISFSEIRDSESNGITSANGHLLNNDMHHNATNPDFWGYSSAAVKGVNEYEAAYNFIHDNQANGLWCDHQCQDMGTAMPIGAHFHDNLVVDNMRWGIRYEYSPIQDFTDPPSNGSVSFLAERNIMAGNGYEGTTWGGASMQNAQYGTFKDNWFGPVTLNGVTYRHNNNNRALKFSHGAPRTALYQAKTIGNTLNGETIDGCNHSSGQVECLNNTP